MILESTVACYSKRMILESTVVCYSTLYFFDIMKPYIVSYSEEGDMDLVDTLKTRRYINYYLV